MHLIVGGTWLSSVDPECLAKMPGLLNQLNHIDLLLKENSEEVSVVRASREKLTKGVLILISSIKGRGETINKALCKFAVSGVDHSLERRIILFEVRCHQVWLEVPLPESFHLQALFHQAAA